MTDSSTAQATGMTEAQAADRLFARYQSDEDHGDGETRDDESQPEEVEVDPEGEEPVELPDDESDDEADAEDQPQEPDLSQTFKVKVGDDEAEVTLHELIRGFHREQDYTRKTQAIADERKALAGARDDYLAKLETVGQIIESSQPRVDQSLRKTDPAEWSAQMLQHRQWADQKQAVAQEQGRLSAEQEKEQARELQALVKAEREKLLGVIPEWTDAAVAKAETEKMIRHGEAYGYSREEVEDVVDHRAVAILRDAMRYRELKAKSETTRATVAATRTASPGPKPVPSRASEERNARNRLASSGSTDAAAQLILMKGRRR